MAKQYDNTNSGAAFKNDRKEKDSHPDLKGSLNVEGTDYWLSMWKKQDKNGNPYYSIAVTPKEAATAGARPAAKKPAADDLDDLL